MAGTTIARLQATVGMNTKGVESGAKRTTGILKGLAGGVTRIAGGILGAQVVTGAIRGITSFAKGAISAGSDATEMLGKFGVTFGDMTDSLTSDLDVYAAATGRSRYAMRGMAADFGAVLKGMHLSEQATASYSGSLAQLAVDVGSFANVDASVVMDKFRAGITGEYESLKSLGIVINAAMVDQELLTMGIEGGAKAATQAQLVQARYNLIMAATADAQGDAARTSSSWANQTVAMKAIWSDFQTDIGQGLTTAFGPLLGTLVKLAGSALPKLGDVIANDVMPSMANFVQRTLDLANAFSLGMDEGGIVAAGLNLVGEALGRPLPENMIQGIWKARDAIGGLRSVIDSFKGEFNSQESVAGGLAVGMMNALGIDPKITSAIYGVLDPLESGVRTRITKIRAAVLLSYGARNTVTKLMGALGIPANATSAIMGTFDSIAGTVTGGIARLRKAVDLAGGGTTAGGKAGLFLYSLGLDKQSHYAVANAIDGIIPTLRTGLAKIPGVMASAGSVGGGLLDTLLQGIDFSGVQGIVGEIGSAFGQGGIGAAISTALGSGLDLASMFMSIRTQLISNLFDVGAELVGMLGEVFPGLAPIIQAGLQPLLSIGQTVWDSVAQIKGALFDGLIAALPELLGAVGSLITSLVPVLLQAAAAIGPIIEGLAPLVADLLPQISGLISTILSVVVASLPTIASLFGTAIEIIGSLLPVVEAVLPVVGSLIQGIGPIAQQAFGVIGQVIADVMPVAMGIIESFSALIQERMPQIQTIISGALAIIQSIWDAVWPALGTAIQVVWGIIETLIGGALDVIGGIISAGLSLIRGDWDGVWQGLTDAFAGIATTIEGVVTGLINGLIGIIVGKKGDFLQAGQDLLDGMRQGIKSKVVDVIGEITGALGSVVGAVKRLLGIHSPSTVFIDMAMQMMNGLVKGIDKNEAKVMEKVAGTISKLLKAFQQLQQLNAGSLSGVADVGAFTRQYLAVVDVVMDAMAQIAARFDYKLIWTQRKNASRIRDVFNMIALDLDKIKVIPLADISMWGTQLVALVHTAVDALFQIKKEVGNTNLERAVGWVQPVATVLQLVNASFADMTVVTLPDLGQWASQFVSATVALVGAINTAAGQIGLAAMQSAEGLVGSLTALFGLIGAAKLSEMVPANADTFETNAIGYVSQIGFVGGLLVGWLNSITQPWRDVLAEVAPLAGLIKQVYDLLGVNLNEIQAPGATFLPRLLAYLNGLIQGAPLVRGAVRTIAALWADTESMAADAALGETIKSLFSVLDLNKTINELTTETALNDNQHKLPLVRVITRLVDDLQLAAPLLKNGLAEVALLFDGAMESTLAIGKQISEMFKHLAEAIKSGVEFTTAEGWDLSKLINMVGQMEQAAGAVSGMSLPSFGAGSIAGPPANMPMGPPASAGLGDKGGAGGSLEDRIVDAITSAMAQSQLKIELNLVQAEQERREFTARLGRIEKLFADYVVAMEAGT